MTTINLGDISLIITDEEKGPDPRGFPIPQTFLDNPEALFYALNNSRIFSDPEALAKASQTAESVSMWVTLNKHQHQAVNGRLATKYFKPEQLKWYMNMLVEKHRNGLNERSIARTGSYHVAGKSCIVPCEELINLCAEHHIVIKTCFCDGKSLNAIRRLLRHTTMAEMDKMWREYGLPLKQTSYIMVGRTNHQLGKTYINFINDDVERCILMLYFSKVYQKNGVLPGVRAPLDAADVKATSRLTKGEKKFARGARSHGTKLSKADLKLLARGRKKKKKKTKGGRKPLKKDSLAREMNKKFELLSLKRSMGLEKTIV